MSLARLGEVIENPSVTQIMAAYPTKKIFDEAVKQGKIKPTTEAGVVANIYNRIVNEALAQQAQTETTVFQDNTQSAPQMGLAAAQQMQGQPAGAGLDQIPVPEQMFNQPQGMAGGGIVAFQSAGFVADRRLLAMMNGQERAEYQTTGKIPARLQNLMQPTATPVATFSERVAQPAGIKADPTTAGMMTDPIFGMGEQPPTTTQAQINESIIAQAQRGEGPNVHRPAAPADAAVVPPGGPVIPRPTGLETKAAPTSVVKKPETAAKQLSIFDEAKNAANKLNAYKTQFGIGGEDPDEAMRKKLKELQEGSKEERREAAYMAMIMAGLGIAGGTSPYFATNLKEAIPALKEYGVAKRDIKKADMEYTKMETELNRAAEARKRGDMELALRLQESAADRELRLRQVVAAERAASKPSQLGELINLATKGTPEERTLARSALLKTGPKPMSQYERATIRQRSMRDADAALSKNMAYGRLLRSSKPEDQATARKMREDLIAEYMQSASGGSNLGGATLLSYGDE